MRLSKRDIYAIFSQLSPDDPLKKALEGSRPLRVSDYYPKPMDMGIAVDKNRRQFWNISHGFPKEYGC